PGPRLLQAGGQAEDRHDLRGDRNVEAVLPREAVRHAAKRVDDGAQRAVVHVHDTAPGDAPRIDAEAVAPIDVIVDQRGEQIVRRSDGMEVAREMKVDVLHRHDLGVSATGRAALHAEAGAERWLPQAAHGLGADPVQSVAETDRGRGLTLAGRGRVDRRYKDQLAVLSVFERFDEIEGDLGLGGAVVQQRLGRDADLFADLCDRLHFGLARYFDIRFEGHGRRSS